MAEKAQRESVSKALEATMDEAERVLITRMKACGFDKPEDEQVAFVRNIAKLAFSRCFTWVNRDERRRAIRFNAMAKAKQLNGTRDMAVLDMRTE